MIFNTFSPSVHTACLLPRGVFSFLHNIKLPPTKQQLWLNRRIHIFYLFRALVGTKFSKIAISFKPNIHHVYSFILQYTLCCSLVATVAPSSTLSLSSQYHHHIYSHAFAFQIICYSVVKRGSHGVLRGSHSGTRVPDVKPLDSTDPTCISGLYYWPLIIEQAETTGKEGKKNASWHQAAAQAWFHTAWCFCLEKRQTPDGGKTEKKKKNFAWGIKGSKSSTEKTHRPKAAIQSNSSIIAVLWELYEG